MPEITGLRLFWANIAASDYAELSYQPAMDTDGNRPIDTGGLSLCYQKRIMLIDREIEKLQKTATK